MHATRRKCGRQAPRHAITASCCKLQQNRERPSMTYLTIPTATQPNDEHPPRCALRVCKAVACSGTTSPECTTNPVPSCIRCHCHVKMAPLDGRTSALPDAIEKWCRALQQQASLHAEGLYTTCAHVGWRRGRQNDNEHMAFLVATATTFTNHGIRSGCW